MSSVMLPVAAVAPGRPLVCVVLVDALAWRASSRSEAGACDLATFERARVQVPRL
jgi:hypothetical protein